MSGLKEFELIRFSRPCEDEISRMVWQMLGKVDWEYVIKMKEQMNENEERRMIQALRKPGIWGLRYE